MRAESLSLILALQQIASTYGIDLTDSRKDPPQRELGGPSVQGETFSASISDGRAQDERDSQTLDALTVLPRG